MSAAPSVVDTRVFLTDEDIEEAAGVVRQMTSMDLRNKETGLRRLILLFQSPAHRALFDVRPEWFTALRDELLGSKSDTVACLAMRAISLLATDVKRCPKLASDAVLAFVLDVLARSLNTELLTVTLCLVQSLVLNEQCAQSLTADFKLCAYVTDLASSPTADVQAAALRALFAFTAAPHALVFRAVFCRKRGFLALCSVLDASARGDEGATANAALVLNIVHAFFVVSEQDTTLKRVFMAGGIVESLGRVVVLPDTATRHKALALLLNLATTFRLCSNVHTHTSLQQQAQPPPS